MWEILVWIPKLEIFAVMEITQCGQFMTPTSINNGKISKYVPRRTWPCVAHIQKLRHLILLLFWIYLTVVKGNTGPLLINGYNNVFHTKNYRREYFIPNNTLCHILHFCWEIRFWKCLAMKPAVHPTGRRQMGATVNKVLRISGARRQKVSGDE